MIRVIAESDLKPVSQLFISVFSNLPWNENWQLDWAYERICWIYSASGFVGYIATNNRQATGAIMGHFIPFRGKKGFQIVEFFVDNRFQNRGIGTKLLKRLETKLRQNNFDFVSLLTAKDSDAESFYVQQDYQRDCKIVLLRKTL